VAAKPKTAVVPALADDDYSADSNDENGVATDQSKWFSGHQWSEIFIPSLSQALYVARNPFDDFKKDSPKFIKTVQDIFALSHSEIIYKFRAKDKFIEKVRIVQVVLSEFLLI
jgi:hypothetical protein